jgi:hypothetical protein
VRKRRRWWFAGLTLALLAACVGVRKWSERPPYAFMKGAKLAYIGPSKSGNFEAVYSCREDVLEIVEAAEAELGMSALTLRRSGAGAFRWELAKSLPPLDNVQIFASPGSGAPEGTQTLIVLDRAPTIADRVRAMIYSLGRTPRR